MVRLVFRDDLLSPSPATVASPPIPFSPMIWGAWCLCDRLQSVAVKFHLLSFWLFTQHAYIFLLCCRSSALTSRSQHSTISQKQEHLQNRPLGFGGRYSLSLTPKEQSEINLIKFLIFKVILDTLKGQTPNTLQLRYCIYASDKKILSQSK